MLSEILASFAEIRQVIVEEEGYLLAHVTSKGGDYLAEVVPQDAADSVDWFDMEGLFAPLASKDMKGVRVRVFDPSGRRLLVDMLKERPLTELESLELALGLVPVLKRLTAENLVLGYLGPESVLVNGSSPMLLASRRGCPGGPFTAPEAALGKPGDPRSTVYALGTLIFRCIAGTDSKDQQIRTWRKLSGPTQSLLESVVGERPEDRLPNIGVFGREIRRRLREIEGPPPEIDERTVKPETPRNGAPKEETEEARPARPAPPVSPSEGFVRKRSRDPKRRGTGSGRFSIWPVVLAVVLVAAAAILFLPDLLSGGGGAEPVPVDSTAVDTTAAATAVQDSLENPPADDSTAAEPDTMPPSPQGGPSVIWVSNRASETGVEVDYRTGVLASYSHVYPFAGGRPRETSLLMLRRDDPSQGIERQTAWPDAEAIMLSDSSLTAIPVDLSVLVGSDLRYAGINGGILRQPVSPVGTLYVEVINQGMEFPPDGSTPAHLWLAGEIDGRSISVPEQGEWLLSVVETRWGDRRTNEEIPLSYGSESTAFLYHRGSSFCRAAEAAIREAVQPLPRPVAGPPEGVIVPDIWILVSGQAAQ